MTADPIEQFRAAMAAAGLTAPAELAPGGRIHRFSTNGKRGDLSGWYLLHIDGVPAGAFGDYRRGFSQTWCAKDRESLTPQERQAMRERMHAAQAEREREQREAWAKALERNAATWHQCQRLTAGDAVHRYLAGRCIALEDLPSGPPPCLRFHPALACYEGGELIGRFPAMVGAIVDPSGRCIGLHRTYLAEHGCTVTKAAISNAKKMTTLSGPMAGACIPLVAPGIDGVSGVAEGIETALACALATGIPTVAAISAGGLERWQWPADTQAVYIFADNDASGTGQKAARALADRVAGAGLAWKLLTPTTQGTDWADAWAERATA